MERCTEMAEHLNRFFAELWPEIYRFFYYRVQNKEEAEELTQETFQKVYPVIIEQQVEEKKIRAYVFSAARNTLTDLWRARGRCPKIVQLNSVSEGAAALYDKRELEDGMVVQEAMNKLPRHYRQVLKWRIIEGYSVQEVAVKMRKTPGAIRSMQYRALHSLRDILKEGGYVL